MPEQLLKLKDAPEITDEMIERLFDEHKLGESLKAAEEKKKGMSKEQWHKLRVLCKRDLFFLCFGVLGNRRLSTDLHGDLCTHVKNTENERFRELLLPRDCFKSTILTVGHSIQTILPYTEEDAKYDDDPTPIPYPANLGTDCCILIAHETHESASRFLFAITNHVTSNVLLLALFPEIVPSPRKHRINKHELELPRTTKGKPEPTIDTLGVGGKSQGRHYNYIKLDDIYGDKARDSAAESATTKDWFDNIQAFFSRFAKDKLDLIGTRYSYDDIYAHAEEMYGPALVKYSRSIEERDANGVLYSIFPEEFPLESLAIIRKNKKVFSAQYLNNPDQDEAGFNEEWKHYFYWASPTEISVFVQGKPTRINIRDLDICFLIDPGLGTSGGFAVTGMDHLKRVFVLQSLRLAHKAPEFVDLLFKTVMKWQPRIVAIESDVFAATYESWLYSEMMIRNVRFMIEPVHTKRQSKDFRIAGLSPYMSSQQLFVNESQTDLMKEIDQWGKTKDIHILDALAYGPEVWRPGSQPGKREELHASSQQSLQGRDVQTGYSQID